MNNPIKHKSRKNTQAPLSTVIVLALAANLAACGGGAGTPTATTSPATADFDNEVYSHQAWAMLSPEKESINEPTGNIDETFEIDGIKKYRCTREEYSMTETPKEFVAIDPDESVMWLGNLIQGSSHLNVGSLSELSIRERAPLTLSINLLKNDNYRIVDKPSLSTVQSAIGDLVERAIEAGNEASSSVYFESEEAHSSMQTTLDFGFTAEYLGASTEGRLSVDKVADEKTYFAYFIQNAFTVSMELPTAPHDMVSDDLTQDMLDDLKARGKIGEDNPPLYISSMTYGRVLIYKITSRYSVSEIKSAINASYDGGVAGGSVSISTKDKEVLSEARIEISAFGGRQSNIEALIRGGRLADYFTGDTRLDNMQPISFEVRNLQDNSIAGISRTTTYDIKQCTFEEFTAPPRGEIVKVFFDKVYIPYDCDAGVNKGEIYGRFDVIAGDESGNLKTKRIVTLGMRRIQSENTLVIPKQQGIEIARYKNQQFRISGQLKDEDGGARGADDIVGNWNANQNDISRLPAKTYTKKAVGNCSGKNPTLTYRIQHVKYITD
ncbi:MAG TPA: hypothetical protein ENJ87_07630 [Gammaproteobacteria bacterium]|nr:hypothetical protein [Gammaproteobacteria bacterium]